MTFHTTFLTLLRSATGEKWPYLLQDMTVSRQDCVVDPPFDPNMCGFTDPPIKDGCIPMNGCAEPYLAPFYWFVRLSRINRCIVFLAFNCSLTCSLCALCSGLLCSRFSFFLSFFLSLSFSLSFSLSLVLLTPDVHTSCLLIVTTNVSVAFSTRYSFVVLMAFIMLNLITFSVLDSFSSRKVESDGIILTPADEKLLVEVWSEFDREGKGRLIQADLVRFFRLLPKPMGFAKAERRLLTPAEEVSSDTTFFPFLFDCSFTGFSLN